MLGGVVAIATGLAEWCDTTGEPKRFGAAHAVLNSIGFSTYAVALSLRVGCRRRVGEGSSDRGEA